MTTPAIHLRLLVLTRICTTAIFMTYPACLRVLLVDWDMTATQGGMVQGAFTGAFAVSLLGASRLCDRIGAKRVFNASTLLSAIAALLFAAFARSYESAMLFAALVGLAQGGTYTPAIMLASANARQGRRASAVGWVLAGMSAGYVVSIILSNAMLAAADYSAAFWATGALPAAGWILGHLATRHARDHGSNSSETKTRRPDSVATRHSRLLIIGYVGHCWELFGAWAWMPAFLGASLATGAGLSPIELGIWTALTLHVSGFLASFLSGAAADRFGVVHVLVGFAALGALCSATIGWMPSASPVFLLCAAAIYGFATIGDSAVLSSAMTETVSPDRLGSMLGFRSVLGVGVGALSPIAFGAALDSQIDATGWGLAFCTLALGGALAVFCAAKLR